MEENEGGIANRRGQLANKKGLFFICFFNTLY